MRADQICTGIREKNKNRMANRGENAVSGNKSSLGVLFSYKDRAEKLSYWKERNWVSFGCQDH